MSQLGLQVGRYLLMDRIGTGSTAEVFRARVLSGEGEGSELAFRRLRPELARDEARRTQLLREAELARGLRHPLFCSVFEVGELEGLPYLTMELVSGPSLARLLRYQQLRGRPAPVAAAVQICLELCAGLHHAHSPPFGVIHGDLSPGNVLLEISGSVKLVDLGAPCGEHLLQGTLGYLAPEQLAGEPVGPGADLYACAVLLWELLANRRLFPARSLAEATRLRRAVLPPPSQLGAPVCFDLLLERALSPRAAERFQNGRELRLALRTAAQPLGEPPSRAAVAGWLEAVFPSR